MEVKSTRKKKMVLRSQTALLHKPVKRWIRLRQPKKKDVIASERIPLVGKSQISDLEKTCQFQSRKAQLQRCPRNTKINIILELQVATSVEASIYVEVLLTVSPSLNQRTSQLNDDASTMDQQRTSFFFRV